jgi:hypothetical protein
MDHSVIRYRQMLLMLVAVTVLQFEVKRWRGDQWPHSLSRPSALIARHIERCGQWNLLVPCQSVGMGCHPVVRRCERALRVLGFGRGIEA